MDAPEPATPGHCAPVLAGHRSVLVVCAHPDDESFGLGAIIAALTDHGVTVDVLCLTRGEASTLGAVGPALARTRRAELRAAADALGVRTVHQCGYPDGGLAGVPLPLLAAEVRDVLTDHEAFLVFDEGGVTGHPDHEAATAAACAVARGAGLPVLAWALPERIAAPLAAEFGIDVTGRSDSELDACCPLDRTRQRAAIECHASQSSVNPVVWRRLELSGATDCVRYLVRP